LGLSYSGAAFAQDQVWLRDRRYSEGSGVRAGDLEIHPGLAGEFGYDSNYFLLANKGGEKPIDALRFRLTPSLSLSTISQQRREADSGAPELPKVAFRAGVAATYNEFIATKSENSDDVSKQRNVSGLATLQLTILPQRPVSADIYGDFVRSTQPSNNPEFNYNRMTTRFGGGLIWTPGGGMFDWRVGYEFGLTYFEDETFRPLNNNYNQVNTRGRWRFLPRTALLFDGSASFFKYTNRTEGQTPQLDSTPIRARLGLNGLVTSSFALLAMVGWGSSFYQGAANAQQFDSVLAQAELKWFITPNPGIDPGAATLTLSSVALGFTRDFTNSYLGDFFTQNRGYANLSYFFGGRFLLVANAGVAAVVYPTVFADAARMVATPSFTTVRVDGTLFGEYRVADSLGINATVNYTSNITDQVIVSDRLEWRRVQAFLGVRWFL